MAKTKDEEVTFYKYMPVGQNLIDDLKKGHLYLSKVSDLNDPFELNVYDKKSKRNHKIDNVRILCLTNSHLKKRMWSHYADSHKGVCLTVKLPKKYMREIHYTSKRVYADSNVDEILNDAKLRMNKQKNVPVDCSNYTNEEKIGLIKDKKWADEVEYRAVIAVNRIKDNADIECDDKKNCFMRVKIERMYCGVSFQKDDKDSKTALKLCKENGIEIKNVRLSTSDYSLKVAKKRLCRHHKSI